MLCDLLTLIREKRSVELSIRNLQSKEIRQRTVFPMKIYISTQTGRQYLLCYHYRAKHLTFIRLDSIRKVQPGSFEKTREIYEGYYTRFRDHLWGASIGPGCNMDHIEMTIHVDEGEDHIPQRLRREKRNGTVEQVDEYTWRYTADVYDASEMMPWLRTFIWRIVDLKCSDQTVVDTFYADLQEMLRMYGGDGHAV